MQTQLDLIWTKLEAAGIQYLGDEPNVILDGYDEAELKVLLVRLSTYESTRPSMTLPLLYQIIVENTKNIFVDRGYLPPKKDLEIFHKLHIPLLFGMVTKQPARKFDVMAVSNAIIMETVNIPQLLHGSGIDLMFSRRMEDEDAPIIVLGGANVRNVEYLFGDYTEAPFEGTGGFVDAVVMGAAEESLPKFLEMVKELKKTGISKKNILIEIGKSKLVAGLYLPWAYKNARAEDGSLIKTEPFDEYADWAPKEIEAAMVFVDKHKPLTKDFVSWMGGNGSADIEISRGCGARCNFCQEGFTERPYSQRTVEQLTEWYEEARVYCGAEGAGCYAFNWSHHTHIYQILKMLYKKFGRVGLISNRIDVMSDNKELLRISHKLGNRHWTAGVEGCSDRLRSALNKGATEVQILKALSDAMDVGYTEIKMFFMALGNETPEDLQECCAMLQKLYDIREAKGKKTFIRMSFTPLFSKSFTPLQWQAVRPALDIKADSLRPIVEKCQALGFGFRTSVKRSEIRIANLLEQGDRRLTALLIKSSLYDEFIFYGNVPKTEPPRWEARLTASGLSWETFFNEKDVKYVFAWDHITFGVRRKSLYRSFLDWLKYKEDHSCLGHRRVIEEDGYSKVDLIGRPVWDVVPGQCVGCGGCPTKKIIEELVSGKPGGQEMGEIYTADQLGVYTRSTNAVLRFKYEIDPKHAGVPKNVWPRVIARAFMLSNEYAPESFNKTGRVTMTQLPDEEKQPIFGIDYCDLGMTEYVPAEALDLKKIQSECRGITILGVKASVKMSQFSGGSPWNTYEVLIPEDFDISISQIADAMQGIENKVFHLRKFEMFGKGSMKPVYYDELGENLGQFWLFSDKRILTMRIPMDIDPFQVFMGIVEAKRSKVIGTLIKSLGSFRFSEKERDVYGDPIRVGMLGEILSPEEDYASVK